MEKIRYNVHYDWLDKDKDRKKYLVKHSIKVLEQGGKDLNKDEDRKLQRFIPDFEGEKKIIIIQTDNKIKKKYYFVGCFTSYALMNKKNKRRISTFQLL